MAEIEAGDKPTIYALNKIDQFRADGTERDTLLSELLEEFPDSLPISALRGKGISALLDLVEEKLHARMAYLSVTIPYARGDLVNLFHKRGTIDAEHHTDLGTHIEGKLPAYLALEFDDL